MPPQEMNIATATATSRSITIIPAPPARFSRMGSMPVSLAAANRNRQMGERMHKKVAKAMRPAVACFT